jgi:hypothetical protein
MNSFPNPKTLTYKDKQIIHISFKGMSSLDDICDLIERSKLLIHSQPAKSVYSVTDITDMHVSPQIKDMFLDFIKSNKPYMKASAVIGVTGLKQFIFNTITKLTGRDIKSFDSEQQAKDWFALQK